jgi:hypothetical protein
LGCNQLLSISFETDSELTPLESDAFYYCYSLKSVTTPPMLKSSMARDWPGFLTCQSHFIRTIHILLLSAVGKSRPQAGRTGAGTNGDHGRFIHVSSLDCYAALIERARFKDRRSVPILTSGFRPEPPEYHQEDPLVQ